MRHLLVLVALVLLVGCGGPSYKLEDRWSPLEQVVENPTVAPTGMTMTFGDTCRVWNLKEWLADYPPGSVEYEALLMHEQLHSQREFAFPGGPLAWGALYALDKSFKWKEEQLGWAKELTHLVQNGRMINVQEVAFILSRDYVDMNGEMVSFADALKWAQDTVTAAQQMPVAARKLRRH